MFWNANWVRDTLVTLFVRIVQRQFHHEFYENEYPTYSPEKQIKTLHAIEEYVTSKFGKDSDLEKTIRFVKLVILYKQSKIWFILYLM